MRKVRIIDGHWIWIGARISNKGYGRMHYPETDKDITAHRLAWKLFVGPIPEGTKILHKHEGIKLCVNPDHLYAGDTVDNSESHRKNSMAGFVLLENLRIRVAELESGVQSPEIAIRLDELKRLQGAPAPIWYDEVNLKESYLFKGVLKLEA